jgi:enoyl-[acyl-carrier-protein] reductase (NADH)
MDKVVNTILFMLSDMAPSVTGQYLAIDGGYQNT